MERINAIKGTLPKGPESEPISNLATLVGEGLDDIRSQQHMTRNAEVAADADQYNGYKGIRNRGWSDQNHGN